MQWQVVYISSVNDMHWILRAQQQKFGDYQQSLGCPAKCVLGRGKGCRKFGQLIPRPQMNRSSTRPVLLGQDIASSMMFYDLGDQPRNW